MTRSGILLVSVLAGTGAIAGVADIAQGVALPEAPGKQQILDSCTRCHGVDVIVAQPRSPDEWGEVVGTMIGQGAAFTDEAFETVMA
ncbi:hypothetical protein GCM10007973_29670 [Polymorphobacter multimanifer]|nr:hypothetical protein [Polymorphobacter multimanifer]GGI91449.1 hypothetical protein GCM10007973_29670 [Polymorphobacter multimanifer]